MHFDAFDAFADNCIAIVDGNSRQGHVASIQECFWHAWSSQGRRRDAVLYRECVGESFSTRLLIFTRTNVIHIFLSGGAGCSCCKGRLAHSDQVQVWFFFEQKSRLVQRLYCGHAFVFMNQMVVFPFGPDEMECGLVWILLALHQRNQGTEHIRGMCMHVAICNLCTLQFVHGVACVAVFFLFQATLWSMVSDQKKCMMHFSRLHTGARSALDKSNAAASIRTALHQAITVRVTFFFGSFSPQLTQRSLLLHAGCIQDHDALAVHVAQAVFAGHVRARQCCTSPSSSCQKLLRGLVKKSSYTCAPCCSVARPLQVLSALQLSQACIQLEPECLRYVQVARCRNRHVLHDARQPQARLPQRCAQGRQVLLLVKPRQGAQFPQIPFRLMVNGI